MIITPGPYTELSGCCGIDSYDLGHASFRIPFDSAFGCAVWHGSGGCPDISAVDVKVSVVNEYGVCRTIIESSLLDVPLEFEGSLPHDMEFSLVNAEGDEIACSIESAVMVPFSLAREKCSPCACARCLPRKFCAVVDIAGDSYNDPIFAHGEVTFDCETNSWHGDIGYYSIDIGPKAVAEGICGLDVAISGPRGSAVGEIILESPLSSGTIGGTVCQGSDGTQTILGEIRGVPGPQAFVSEIDASFDLLDDEYPVPNVIGTVTIRDQSCGECIGCKANPPIQTTCCSVPVPSTLHGTATYDCETSPCTDSPATTLFIYSASKSAELGFPTWVGTFQLCGNSWAVYLYCVGNPDTWVAYADGCGFTRYFGSNTLSECNPLQQEFLWSWTPDPPTSCCPDGGFGQSFHVVITE